MTVSDPRSSRTGAATRGIPDTVAHLRATFRSGRTKPVAWRLGQLEAIERMVREREDEFLAALAEDLGRPAVDAWLADLAPVAGESEYARKQLRVVDASPPGCRCRSACSRPRPGTSTSRSASC